jgi:hypothetical protein
MSNALHFEDADLPLTVAELIVMLKAAPQDAAVYIPDVGCGCCSHHHGIGVVKEDKIRVVDDKRVLLFGSLPTESKPKVVFKKGPVVMARPITEDFIQQVMKKLHDPDHVWEL